VLDKFKNKARYRAFGPRTDIPLKLQHAQARRSDLCAGRALAKAIQRKAETEAVLKRLGFKED
jgi:hypothetical protein